MELQMKSKVFSLHGKMDILNEKEEVIYTVSSKAVSIHNTTYLKDASGKEVAVITHKPISVHGIHFIELANGENFEVKGELFHIFKQVINVEGLGWQLTGDFTGHNYQIQDANGQILATTHVKWISIHNIYYLDIRDETQMDKIVALYVTLERILQDRENSRVTADIDAGNSN